MMSPQSRRNFLASSGKMLVGTVALGSLVAHASEEHEHAHATSGKGLAIDAKAENTCGTCRFWGGMRMVSKDGGQVLAQSMGWCNNPDSMQYHKLTMADHEMKKPGIWKKWGAL